MTVLSISTHNFRNLADQELKFHPNFNLIYGANGSGKTSLLEAIYSLTSGSSFRTKKLESIIKRVSSESVGYSGEKSNNFSSVAHDSFTLFGLVNNVAVGPSGTKIGIRKSLNDRTKIKIDGELLSSAMELARICPTTVIEPANSNLLVGASQLRRKFLDWGVFHVEHSFAPNWKYYAHSLKQRNALLKYQNYSGGSIDSSIHEIWATKLSEFGEQLDLLRKGYFVEFVENLDLVLELFEFSERDNLRLSYRRGWDRSTSLFDALMSNIDKDLTRKFTSVGPHRMDVRIGVGSSPAIEVLSRGQQKLLVVAMHIAQVMTLKASTGSSCLVLLDDLAAELDQTNTNIVLNKLFELDAQLVCTATDVSVFDLSALKEQQNFKMFHVEHGLISEA